MKEEDNLSLRTRLVFWIQLNTKTCSLDWKWLTGCVLYQHTRKLIHIVQHDDKRDVSITDGWDGGDDLSQLELVEDGGLSGGVQPHHEDPHLLLAEEALEQAGEHVSHDEGEEENGVKWLIWKREKNA